MEGTQFGETEPVQGNGSGGGGATTGHGAAPATSAPSTPPVGTTVSPETVRAILAGTRLATADTQATGAVHRPSSLSAPTYQAPEGTVLLKAVEQVLPGLLSRATNNGVPLTVALVRPGPAATALRRAPVPPAGEVADLAAALAVSLVPDQYLLQAGTSHLAVVLPGGPVVGQRQADRLMRRAAGAGAPMLTFATAHHPRDGASAAALVEIARMRLEEPVDDRFAPAVADEEGFSRRRAGALWAAVAAAVVVAAIALSLHGHGHGTTGSTNALGHNSASTSSGASSVGASGNGLGSTGSGVTGGQSTGTGTAGGTAGSPSSPGPSSSGSSGGSVLSGLPGGDGTTSTDSTGSSPTATTLPVGTGVTQTTLPGLTPTTTVPGSTTTTTTVPGGTGTNQCSGILNSLLCAVNGLLGGGG